jgi:hypothetical protein
MYSFGNHSRGGNDIKRIHFWHEKCVRYEVWILRVDRT